MQKYKLGIKKKEVLVNDNKKDAEKAYSGELFMLLVKEGQVKEI